MNKKGFLDTEVLFSAGFIILTVLAWAATVIGYRVSQGMFEETFPIWQVLVIMLMEAGAAYYFAAQG